MRFREFATDSSESLMSIALLIGQQHQEGAPAMTMDAFLEKLDNAGINMNIESFRQAYETDSNVQSVVNELIKSNKLDGSDLEFKPDANDDTPDERVSKMARKAVKTRENIDQFRDLYRKGIGSDDDVVTLRELIKVINDDALYSDQYPQLRQFVDAKKDVVTANKIKGISAEDKIQTLIQAINDDEFLDDIADNLMKSYSMTEDKYKPHYMYKGTKKDYKAKLPTTKKYHDRLGKTGYSHDDPETKKKEEGKMKGGTDLGKFMGYKPGDMKDPNRKLPKVIAIDPFKNTGAQLKKLGSKKDSIGYYDEDASERTSWVLKRNTKTTEGTRPGKLSKGHPNYKKQAAAIAISKQKAK